MTATPIVAPRTLFVVEAIGASSTESTHSTYEAMERAMREAESLTRVGARVQVLVYEPTGSIFASPNWGQQS